MPEGKILVFATSFNDDLPTRPPETGRGREILENLVQLSDGRVTLEFRCNRNPHDPLTASELDGICAIIADLEVYDRPLLESVGSRSGGTLELIARYGVGYDAIDIAAATEAGVLVANTPGANSRPTAEWAVSTLLDIAGRRMPHHERSARGLGKDGPSRLDVSGRTLGVVGTGAIGRTVVELLSGFGMTVIATDPYPNLAWAEEHGVKYVDLPELCETADFITMHAAATEQIIGARDISRMKPTTALINCAREVLVDTAAAYDAVRDGRLWGYGLDEAWTHPSLPLAGLNIAVSGHVGSDTDRGKALMQLLSARSVADYFAGKKPASVINPDVDLP